MLNTVPVDGSKISVKYLLTTLIVMIIVTFVFSKIVEQTIVIKDKSGNVTGEGVTQYRLKKFGK